MKKVIATAIMLASANIYAMDCIKTEQAVQKALSRVARDPSSVQVREIAVYQYEDKDKPINIVVGEVNGKNAYGGHTGYKKFGIHITAVGDSYLAFAHTIVIDNQSQSVFNSYFAPKMVTKLCSN